MFVPDVSDLVTSSGHNTVHGHPGHRLALGFARGGFSRQSIPVIPGSVFEAEVQVWGVRSGKLMPVKFGPVFLDAAGNVLKWWSDHDLPVWPEGQTIRVRETAPKNAAVARLGIHGPWLKDEETNLVYEFAGARMRRLKA